MSSLDPFGWGARRKARQDAAQARQMRADVKAEHAARYWTCPHGHTIEIGQRGPAGCIASLRAEHWSTLQR